MGLSLRLVLIKCENLAYQITAKHVTLHSGVELCASECRPRFLVKAIWRQLLYWEIAAMIARTLIASNLIAQASLRWTRLQNHPCPNTGAYRAILKRSIRSESSDSKVICSLC